MRLATRFTRLMWTALLWVVVVAIVLTPVCVLCQAETRTEKTKPSTCKPLHPIQEEMMPFVHDMLTDAYYAYFTNAFPHDMMNVLSPNEWNDEYGGYGLTLIDSLDTLAVMGRHDVFRKVAKWIEDNANFDRDFVASAFETNIRTVGGLLGAHLLYEEGFVPLVPDEHDYQGGLLVLAVDMATRLLGTYKTALGTLFNTFNLRSGVHPDESDATANAAAGTFSIEMMLISRLTGDPRFETAGRWAQQVVHDLRIGDTSLMGSQFLGHTGEWASVATSVGGGVDSTLEYALKTHVLTGEVTEWLRYEVERRAAHKFVGRNGIYMEVDANIPSRQNPQYQSLAAFYPGLLVLGGQRREATTLIWNSQSFWRRYGALAERLDVVSGRSPSGSAVYLLRPEHIESVYYLYRTTRDPVYLEMGREAALSLHLRSRTARGFSALTDIEKADGRGALAGDMESFLMAETFKYLFLLFDECNPLHAVESPPTPDQQTSTVGWVFTTEAHPIPNRMEWWEESAPWRRATSSSQKDASSPPGKAASARQAKRPAYGVLFPVRHGNATKIAFDKMNTATSAEQKRDLVHDITADFVDHPKRQHVQREVTKRLWHGIRDRAQPFTESSNTTRLRHVQGLRKQVESELLAGGVRGGFTSWGTLNDAENSCTGESGWLSAFEKKLSSPTKRYPSLMSVLAQEEALIRYEYYCSNHVFKDTEYLTHSLNYMR